MTKIYRREHDSLGFLDVPYDAYYGIQTARAKENFPISGVLPHTCFIKSTAMIKMSAAQANMAVGKLDKKIGDAIVKSAGEVIDGRFDSQFVVDVFQAGAGTSHNMNTNEVIANRAIELLGGDKGDYSLVHPNDHVNMSQSTNDVFPSAMRITAVILSKGLLSELKRLMISLRKKGIEFDKIIKSGRTHLQDAVPVRLGQEFSAYSITIERSIRRITAASMPLYTIGLGGTAVGTGLNTHPSYRKYAISYLSKNSGLKLKRSRNMIESMQSMGDITYFSSSLKTLASDLIRIANDLRLLSSGPATGINEINLPPVQPGSSIMPGKINPVMAEVVNMVCFQVIGHDHTVTMASQAGQLELNVMMPVINYNVICSVEILKNAISVFSRRCISGITANAERCKEYSERSAGLATILNQHIGYERSAEIVKESLATGKAITDIIRERAIFSEKDIKRLLAPYAMTKITASVK